MEGTAFPNVDGVEDQHAVNHLITSHDRGVDLPYLIVSSIILPLALGFEWTLEWYENVDFYDDWAFGPKVAAVSGIFALTIAHMVLTPFYLRHTRDSVWKALLPVLSVIACKAFVLVGLNAAPTCVMVANLLFMSLVLHCSRNNVIGLRSLQQPLLVDNESLEEE